MRALILDRHGRVAVIDAALKGSALAAIVADVEF
jgi:hypothetical protein